MENSESKRISKSHIPDGYSEALIIEQEKENFRK